MFNSSCFYSTVKNTSGTAKTFGFLPPHGRQLLPNEEFSVFGDIKQAIIPFERTNARRNIIAFEQAIERGDLTIVSTPAVIMEDATTSVVKALALNNGSLAVVVPCWDTSGDSSQSLIGDTPDRTPLGY